MGFLRKGSTGSTGDGQGGGSTVIEIAVVGGTVLLAIGKGDSRLGFGEVDSAWSPIADLALVETGVGEAGAMVGPGTIRPERRPQASIGKASREIINRRCMG